MPKRTVPRNPNRPEPPRRKPPFSGYHLLDASDMDDRLTKASKEELILLIQKGENAGFFSIFERESEAIGGPQLEIDDGHGWPPGSGPAKKGGAKKSAGIAGKGGSKKAGARASGNTKKGAAKRRAKSPRK